MREKSKVKSGLKTGKKIIEDVRIFSTYMRKKIIEEYLLFGKTKREIWEKYTGHPTEHGRLLRWMRSMGYSKELVKSRNTRQRNSSFAEKTGAMKKSKEELEFEIQVLQNRVKELERQAVAHQNTFKHSEIVDESKAYI